MTRIISPVRLSALVAALALLFAIGLATTTQASANRPDRPTVWVDGVQYNTVVPLGPNGTVKFSHIPDWDAPSVAELETTDNLYVVTTNTMAPLVSDSAHGDSDYNGGRWIPRMVTITTLGMSVGVPELKSEEEVIAAYMAGLVNISAPGDNFLCPVTSKVKGQ